MAEIDVTECPDCSQKGTYEARVLINGRGVYTCPEGHRWQDINERPSDKGVPFHVAAQAIVDTLDAREQASDV
jgi:hypothetical protein